ncbi:MAG: hypothetical protein D6769_03560, partial [Methanobacteriota archaeon]
TTYRLEGMIKFARELLIKRNFPTGIALDTCLGAYEIEERTKLSEALLGNRSTVLELHAYASKEEEVLLIDSVEFCRTMMRSLEVLEEILDGMKKGHVKHSFFSELSGEEVGFGIDYDEIMQFSVEIFGKSLEAMLESSRKRLEKLERWARFFVIEFPGIENELVDGPDGLLSLSLISGLTYTSQYAMREVLPLEGEIDSEGVARRIIEEVERLV